MIKAFEIENINLDDLIDIALDDPQAFGGENKEFRASILPTCKRRSNLQAD
jgi:hypothetical protein